jgi:hypothetical protein
MNRRAGSAHAHGRGKDKGLVGPSIPFRGTRHLLSFSFELEQREAGLMRGEVNDL